MQSHDTIHEHKKGTPKRQGILRLALWGAIGFGVGAIGFGAIRIAGWDLFILRGGSVPSMLGFPTTGAFGGAALGLALRGWTKAAVLAVVGAVAFFMGLIGGVVTEFVVASAELGKGLGEVGEAVWCSIAYAGVPGAGGDVRRALVEALAA